MRQPQDGMKLFTIQQASEEWIAMIEDPATKATAEQKATLIAQIKDATPRTIGTVYGVGRVTITPTTQFCFADATNAIKATMRRAA